jgi:chromatin remodeling complex protein RSC6
MKEHQIFRCNLLATITIFKMQTRSGKVYVNASSSASSLKEKRPSVVEIKVEKRARSARIAARTERLAASKPTPVVNCTTPVINRTSNKRPMTITPTRVVNSSPNRIPYGFVRPTKISNELAKFLGKPAGTEIARTVVSRLINTYIRVNNLQDPQNGRVIYPDSKLRSLLNIGKNDELTYFNLQKYMKHHFYPSDNSRCTSDNSTCNRRPSGFITPTLISDQLAEFLGKPAGTKVSRVDVSRLINTYIRGNNLVDPQNMRVINPDSKLRSLLAIGENDELTYFNLQKYMKPHFYRE